MELILYILFTWLIVTYLITSIHKCEIIRSIIVYFILLILEANIFTIISLNLNLLKISKDSTKFISHLLYRDIIFPFLGLIFINIFYRINGYKKITPIILLILLNILIEFVNIKLQIYSYIEWSFGLSLFKKSILILSAFIVSNFINRIQSKEKRVT